MIIMTHGGTCRGYFYTNWLVATGLVVAAAASAHGQVDTFKPIEIAASHPTCMAVSDRHGILVVGWLGGKARHLAVYPLDEHGEPKRDNVQQVELPRPESLKAFRHFALSVVFHPRLPLLYVWQDLDAPRANAEQQKAIYGEFDHLLVYSVGIDGLKPVKTTGRGEQFAYHRTSGRLAIDPGGRRIYMPNLRDPRPGHNRGALGYFELDENGMPKPVPVPIEGELDAYGLPKTELKMRPFFTVIPREILHPHLGWGYATPMDLPTEKVVLFSAIGGLAVWDTENRRGTINHVVVPRHGASSWGGNFHILEHPKLPVVYGFQDHGEWVYRIEHADGYPTLLPATVRIAGARFHSLPVVMTRRNSLAVGLENGAVFTMELTADGHLTDRTTRIRVGDGRSVRAVAWSDKFDRLYAAVEETK